MANVLAHKTRRSWPSSALTAGLVVALSGACAGDRAVAPPTGSAAAARLAAPSTGADAHQALATLRRATARYHRLDAALADGFVFLHGCEVRPGEGAVGSLYVHFERLMDGVVDPERPDALVYEPGRGGRKQPVLVAAEFAVPYPLWTAPEPPTFLGAELQPEDEFGVWGLHVWVWRDNPAGMFAEANPRVSCGVE